MQWKRYDNCGAIDAQWWSSDTIDLDGPRETGNTLVGGAGDDTYVVGAASITIIENPGEGAGHGSGVGRFVYAPVKCRESNPDAGELDRNRERSRRSNGRVKWQ